MKTIKYVMMGALMLGISAPVFAQTGDPKADTETITKMIKGKSGDVAEMSKKYAKKYKKNTEVLLAMSKAYYEVKDTANARIMAENALKADKKCAKAFIMLGDIQALSDDGGGAAGQYQQAIYFDPKDPEAYYKYANVYKKVSPSEAVAKLEELRTHRPDIAVDALAGRIYYTSNKFGNAIDCYSKAWAEKDKMEERDIRDFAMAYYLTGKAANALEVAKFGLTKAPRDAAFNRLAFFTSSDTKQYEQALQYADALFNKSDSAKFSYFDYTYYGNTLKAMKRYDEAIASFEKALAQEFDSKDKKAGVIKALSDTYSEVENYPEAIKYYEQYLSEYSTPTATDHAGLPQLYYYQASKQTGDEMIASLKKSDELYGQLAEKYADAVEYATFWRARVNNAMDNDQKNGLAKPYYEKLIELYSSRTELNNSDKSRLKEAYLYLISYEARIADDMNAAKAHAEKLIQLDPENAVAKQVLGI
ncbi:MAG: tetratricopeptide repeat protein [Prevotella sp.]|nr:tetratricopeptide repeat protein [Prevotella sp.]